MNDPSADACVDWVWAVSPGEAGLIAARGSFLGIGTDIGGSIRIPSLCCGIYGFKPTPSRVSSQGVRMPFLGSGNGQQAIHPTAGPMGIAVDDLALVMRYTWQWLWRGRTAEKGGDSVSSSVPGASDCPSSHASHCSRCVLASLCVVTGRGG